MRVIHSEKNHHILQSTTTIHHIHPVCGIRVYSMYDSLRRVVQTICVSVTYAAVVLEYGSLWPTSFFFGYCFHSSPPISPQLDRPMIKYNIQLSYSIWRHAHNHQQQKLSFTSLFLHACSFNNYTHDGVRIVYIEAVYY